MRVWQKRSRTLNQSGKVLEWLNGIVESQRQ